MDPADELRNPLTTVRSTVQYLKKSDSDDKEVLAEAAIEEVERMDGIISGMLSRSRVSELPTGQSTRRVVDDDNGLNVDSSRRGRGNTSFPPPRY